jgi:hypothetical protein
LKVRLSTIDRMQNGPSSSASAAIAPEQSDHAQSRESVSICRVAFFPPGLDPVLDCGRGDEDAVLTPEAPTGGAIRSTVLDDPPDGRVDDAAGGVTAGVGQVGPVGIEVPATAGARVLGGDQDEVAGPPGEGIAEVVEGPSGPTIAVGAMATARAGAPPVISALAADLGLGQVLDAGDTLRASAHSSLAPQRTSRGKLSLQPQLRRRIATRSRPGCCCISASVQRVSQARCSRRRCSRRRDSSSRSVPSRLPWPLFSLPP